MRLQQQYWQSWTEMSSKAMGSGAPGKSPWESAMDHWWAAVSPATPDAAREFVDKMITQGKAFFRMAEDFASKLPDKPETSDWMKILDEAFRPMNESFAKTPNGAERQLHQMMAFWEMPFDNWQRFVSSSAIVPGDILRNMPHDDVRAGISRVLQAPGLGYTREEQSQYQELWEAVFEYQKELAEYSQFFSRMRMRAVERLQALLEDAAKKETTINSARTLYDMWVSCCESEYAEQVMTPEYAKLHGRLVNSVVTVKHRLGNIVDEYLGAMNMPTRAELRTLQCRLQETRRENKGLRTEIDALWERVNAMNKAPPTTRTAAPSRTKKRTAVSQKKVVTTKKTSKRRAASN